MRRTNEQSKAELRRRVIQETSLSYALLGRVVVASKKNRAHPFDWILSWQLPLDFVSDALLHLLYSIVSASLVLSCIIFINS